MEGLIPMVYKSLKKKKTRKQYECLSSGASQTYNIADFYTNEDDDRFYVSKKRLGIPEPEKVSGLSGAHHRRYNSVHVDHARSFASGDEVLDHKPKHLVRFRSHRMFSCVTGV